VDHPPDAARVPAPLGRGLSREDRDRARGVALDLRRVRRRRPAPRAGPAGVGDRARRPGRGAAAQRARDARRPLRRPVGRGGARCGEHAARVGGGPLHPRPLRGDAPRRRLGTVGDGGAAALRVPLDGSGAAALRVPLDGSGAAALRVPPGGRHARRPGGTGRGDDPRRSELGGPPRPRRGRGARRRGGPALGGRRRALDDHHQLHLGHDGATQGRPIPPSRRIPERPRRDRPLRTRPVVGVPVDAADVPLQRLVHAVGDHRGRRDARVPARGAGRRDLGPHRGAPRHPPQRGADGRDDDHERSTGPDAGLRARRHHRRCAPEPDDHPRDGADGVPHRARVRPHRDVRAVHGLPVAGRVGRPRAHRARGSRRGRASG